MTRTRLLAAAVVGALTLAGCGGGRDKETSSDTSATSEDAGGESQATGGIDDATAELLHLDSCDTAADATGVTDTEIKIGSSFPQSGIYAAYGEIAKGVQAYFDSVNAAGGVKGRKINFVTKDDAYEPTKTKANVEALTQQDKVFAIFNVVGTSNNQAFWDDTDEACVPNLFVASGAEQWGDVENHPWTIGSIPAYATEGAVLAQYLKDQGVTGKWGALIQNDDFGKGLVESLEKALGSGSLAKGDVQTYEPADPSLDTQVTNLASTNPDVVVVAATALKCGQALNAINKLGLKPKVLYISQVCSSPRLMGLVEDQAAITGVLSTTYLMPPYDPQFASDPDQLAYMEGMAKYASSVDYKNDGLYGYGWTMGAILVKTLDAAPELTRSSVMATARNLDNVDAGVVLPGVSFATAGAEDPFPIESLTMMTYDGAAKHFTLLGDLIDFEGKTTTVATRIAG